MGYHDSTSKLFEPTRTYKPFEYPQAVQMAVEHERMHWIEDELDLSDDVADWKLGRLTEAEKGFVTQILRMFTQSDLNVGGFYDDVLMPHFGNNEVRNLLRSFANREATHQRAYALLNDTLGLPDAEYRAFLEIREMHDKDEFMRDADPATLSGLARALAKGIFNEGVTLFGSFVMLLNFQRRGLMKGMGKVVEWSVKDETKHVEGITWLFRVICAEHPDIVTDDFKKSIYDMARMCVDLEDAFIDLAFETGGVEGITKDGIKEYVRFIADRRLGGMGLKENFGVEKMPLPWVDIILNGADHTNFFENKVAEYEVGSLEGDWDDIHALVIYGRDNCEFCAAAKVLLAENGLDYQYNDLTDIDARTAWFDEQGYLGKERTMPKCYRVEENGKEVYIGGFTELAHALRITT